MTTWVVMLGILVMAITLWLLLRSHNVEGFGSFKDTQMSFADRQNTNFFDKMTKGIFVNPGLGLNDLNSALAQPDVYMPNSVDRDYTSFFVEDPEGKFTEEDAKFCKGAQMPRDLPERPLRTTVACGWYFYEDPEKRSTGILGTQSGPLFTDKLAGGGKWFWNLNDAQKVEEIKRCKRIKDCALLDIDGIRGVCGFCREKGHGVPILSNGALKYPEDAQGSCGSEIATNRGQCATFDQQAESEFIDQNEDELGVAGLVEIKKEKNVCDPDNRGMLSRDCLVKIAKALGFSETGAILRLLKTGVEPSETDKLALESVATAGSPIGAALYRGGNTDVGSASSVFKRLADLQTMGPNSVVQSAAKWLVSGGDEFDACEFNPTAKGPFSTPCLQRAFRSAGCQAAGTKYPTNRDAVSEYANMTWGQINNLFKSLNDSIKSTDSNVQNNALKECLGRGTEIYQGPPKQCEKSVRQRLNDMCPISISETRSGKVYINPTNGALRDNYLFSGCTAAGTCDKTTPDPISQNLLETRNCGAWRNGKYVWDNVNQKWVSSLRQKLEETCPPSISETRGGKVYINPTNGALREEYLFSGCKTAGTCDKSVAEADPISQNLLETKSCGAWRNGKYTWDNVNQRWIQPVRQKLDEMCPLSISETRAGKVYINPTNGALRDNYLFSGCTSANTCDKPVAEADPISQNLLETKNCGAWRNGKYVWDNVNQRWIQSVRQKLDEMCPLSISETRAGKVYINPTNGALRDNYLFSGCTAAGTCDKPIAEADPISKNLLETRNCGAWRNGKYLWDNANQRWATSVRQRLDETCPTSISEMRAGKVYINPTNGALRDNYLFSGCTAAGTCDTITPDPISQNLIDMRNCGAWNNGKYRWDNLNQKWVPI